MPHSPTYIHRLVEGIQTLSLQTTDWVDRSMVQEAFGVSKWTAWRILRRCGAVQGPGGALVCRREELISQLVRIQHDSNYTREIERRKRVETYLESIAQYASRKRKEIARGDVALDLVSSRLETLPPGVDLGRGELRILYSGTEDFLQKIGAVVFALNNDLEEIATYIESGQRPAKRRS